MTNFIKTILCLVFCFMVVSSAQAQDTASSSQNEAEKVRARNYFRMGVDFYRERNFRAALIEFQRAYKTYPHYRLLYNLGQTATELQDYVSAIDYLTSYLRSGGSEIEAQRRLEVQRSIEQLEGRLASLVITSSVEEAEVFVDGNPVGTLPLDKPIRVSSGRRVITATKEGMPDAEKIIDIAAGDHQTVHLEFQESVTFPVYPAGYAEPPDDTNWPAIGTGIAAGAFAAAGITTAILTAFADKKYEEERRRETTKETLDDLRSDAETKAILTDVFLGTSLLSATAMVVFLFIFDTESEDSEEGLDASISASPNGAELIFGGRF